MEWSKRIPVVGKEGQREEFFLSEGKKKERFLIDVTRGKKVDILSLKVHEQESFKNLASTLKRARKKLFSSLNLVKVTHCPVCGRKASQAETVFTVDGADYIQCSSCTHVFLTYRRRDEGVKEHYTKDSSYHATYVDKRNAQLRVEQVARPKALWVREQFRARFGRDPKRILDVGAGAGHFVSACRALGMEADGVELSESACTFAKNYFDIELIQKDFLKETKDFRDYDVVTFWGLIEHVPEPLLMLEKAQEALVKEGLVLASVPHWNSFSTSVQQNFKDTIIRHLHPLEHLQCFTEESILTAFVRSGYIPRALWYFGMDAYELLTQIVYASGDTRKIRSYVPLMNELQARIDNAGMSDEIVLLGEPRHTKRKK